MCDRFRGIREGRLTVSHAHGSAKTKQNVYKQNVCMLQMGVFVKESGSYRPDYLHRMKLYETMMKLYDDRMKL